MGEKEEMAKYRINGRVVSGTELVRIANREFTKDSQGRGRYGRPKTGDGAYAFLRGGTNSRKFRVEWWSSEKRRWM